MYLGKVIGTLVPAVVHTGLEGVPLLWVQPLDKHERPQGRPMVCADGTRMAGPGELVYWEAAREAALTLDPWFVPVDHAVVGIVDGVEIDGEENRRGSAGGDTERGDTGGETERDTGGDTERNTGGDRR